MQIKTVIFKIDIFTGIITGNNLINKEKRYHVQKNFIPSGFHKKCMINNKLH